MMLNQLSPGKHAPEQIDVVIEIPAQADPVKYEVDKDTGMLRVDRFIGTAMRYPANYGYVPGTLGEDGDPIDVLVVTPFPLISGSVIACRPVGLLIMEDESGKDNKILAVPVDKLSTLYRAVQEADDLPKPLLDSIAHFFEHYKDLEPGKWAKLDSWQGKTAAMAEIEKSIALANSQ